MKLTFFDDYKLGVVKGDSIVDVSAAVANVPHTSPGDLINHVIADWDNLKGAIEQAAQAGGVALSSVTLQAALPTPYNTVAMAVNYMEDGTRDAPAPINAFLKSPNSIIGEGGTMVLPDVAATIFEGEAELAVVIGKRASNISEDDAYDHIFGYLNFIDGSARGVPAFYQMKARQTFAPIGPWITTADEIDDPQKLQVQLRVNGELKQNFNTDDMAHNIAKSLAWVSSIHDLEPGDIVATGTNHRGLSALQGGDSVALEVEGLDTLHISIQDDLNRTWPRDTRLERTEAGFDGPVEQATGKYTPGS
ncbi:MAG: fumarylacetoacetate hydrolase family protein [SAR202 cluster bacterium]|jgi:2-keto-4-pentenoate hydratase/2-oxohepta-3-ene-1,7-dioic acid hydratase in catechol pathway|nr:fumarylacetoacetate hydrolase family protein [SAR202 cluster bacterium]